MTRVFYATNRLQPYGARKEYGNRFNTDGPQFYEVGLAEVTWGSRDSNGFPENAEDYSVTFERVRAAQPQQETLAEIPETHRKQAKGRAPRIVKSVRPSP